jgi:hypothetical protein
MLEVASGSGFGNGPSARARSRAASRIASCLLLIIDGSSDQRDMSGQVHATRLTLAVHAAIVKQTFHVVVGKQCVVTRVIGKTVGQARVVGVANPIQKSAEGTKQPDAATGGEKQRLRSFQISYLI